MGTNYYAVKVEPTIMDDRVIHIGKSSVGWRFLFHDNEFFHSFEEFKKFIDTKVRTGEYVLKDEYDMYVDIYDLLDLIELKQSSNNPNNFEWAKNVDGYRFVEGIFS